MGTTNTHATVEGRTVMVDALGVTVEIDIVTLHPSGVQERRVRVGSLESDTRVWLNCIEQLDAQDLTA